MSRIFTVIAHARSGSTLLCRKLDERMAGRVYLEVFHFHLQTILNHLGDSAAAVQAHFAPSDGQDLRDRLASDPMDLLRFLSELNNGRDILFKVFPGHLQTPQLQEVIANSTGVILLRRNLLHSFLSNEIARHKKKWANYDTSDELVDFDTARFVAHMRRMVNFYGMVETMLAKAGVPHAELHYEDIADPVRAEVELAGALKSLGLATAQGNVPTRQLRRQDSRRLASDKVHDPEQLLELLSGLGLSSANDGAASVLVSAYVQALASLPKRG